MAISNQHHLERLSKLFFLCFALCVEHFSSISNVINMHWWLSIVHTWKLMLGFWTIMDDMIVNCTTLYIQYTVLSYVLLCSKRSVLVFRFHLQTIYWQKDKRELNRSGMLNVNTKRILLISNITSCMDRWMPFCMRPSSIQSPSIYISISHSILTILKIQVNRSSLKCTNLCWQNQNPNFFLLLLQLSVCVGKMNMWKKKKFPMKTH